MLWFGLSRRAERLEGLLTANEEDFRALYQRVRLLEKKLGVTYSAGKRKAHYKVAGKVGRPRKHKAYEQV